MKSGIAAVLLLLGLGLVGSSFFVGKTVPEEQELSEEEQEEFSQISASIHMPSRNPDPAADEAKRARLMEMQQRMLDAQKASQDKRRWLFVAGLSLAGVGIAFQFWAWADRRE